MRRVFFAFLVMAMAVVPAARAEILVWETPSLLWGEAHRFYQLDQDVEPEIMWIRDDGIFMYDVTLEVPFAAFSDPSFGGLADHPRDYDNDGWIEFFYYVGPTEFNGRSVHLYDIFTQQIVWSLIAEVGESYEIVPQTPGEAPLVGPDGTPLVYIRFYSDAETIGWEKLFRFNDILTAAHEGSLSGATGLSVSPTPFRSGESTSLSFSLAEAGNCQVSLYDASGRKVSTLVDGWTSAGKHAVMLTAPASGVYLVRLRTGNGAEFSRKVIAIR
jgi:hypothetical protein